MLATVSTFLLQAPACNQQLVQMYKDYNRTVTSWASCGQTSKHVSHNCITVL